MKLGGSATPTSLDSLHRVIQHRGVWTVFLSALLVRFVFILSVPYIPGGDATIYDGLAWRLVQGNGYVGSGGISTAAYPIGTSLLLAAIYRIFGHVYFPARMVIAVLDSCTAALLFLIARGVLSRPQKSLFPLMSGMIYALNPGAIYMSATLMTEAQFTVLFMAALWLSFRSSSGMHHIPRAIAGKSIVPISNALLIGVLGGLMLLIKTVSAVLVGAMGLIVARKARSTERVRCLAIVVCLTGLVVSPWMFRNWLLSGHVALDNHAYVTIWGGNAAFPQPIWYEANRDAFDDFEGVLEWDRNTLAVRKLLDFVRVKPAVFLFYSLRRVGLMLDVDVESFPLAFAYFGLHPFAKTGSTSGLLQTRPHFIIFALLPIVARGLLVAGGLVGCLRRFRFPYRNTVLLLLCVWIIPHSLSWSNSRYLFPMVPVLILPLAWMLARSPQGSRTSESDLAVPRSVRVNAISDLLPSGLLVLALITWISTSVFFVDRIF